MELLEVVSNLNPAAIAFGSLVAAFLYTYIVLLGVIEGHSLRLIVKWPAGLVSDKFNSEYSDRCHSAHDSRCHRRLIECDWKFEMQEAA